MVPVNASLSTPSHASAQLARRGSAHTTRSTQTQAEPAASTDSEVPDFRALFTGAPTPEPAEPVQQNSAPTAESVFGPNPWVANPTGMGPTGVYSFNPIYFATPQTAAKVAQMVGGTVVAGNQITAGGAFAQQQPNQMVEMPDGRLINPGLVAAFYTHGYPQSYIDQLIAGTINNT
jgi:hypothetical protein